jgi:hypothetical protein
MEQLDELAKIVTQFRTKKIDLLPLEAEKGNNYLDVTSSLADGSVKDDEDAARLIGSDTASGKFRMFKSRLKNKLINSLLLVDLDSMGVSSYGRNVLACYRSLYIVKFLQAFSANKTADLLLKLLLKQGIQLELTEVILSVLKDLRHQAAIMGNVEEFEEYNKQFKHFESLAQAEDISKEFLSHLNVYHANSNTVKVDYLNAIKENIEKLEQLRKKQSSYLLNLNYYRLKGQYYFLLHDYKASNLVWQEFDSFIENYKHFDYEQKQAESEIQKSHNYLHMRDYVHGFECAQKGGQIFKPFSNNWFIINEQFYLLAMHAGQYEEAGRTVEAVITNPKFKYQIPNRVEKWKIFEAFFYLMVKAGKVTDETFLKNEKKFRLSRFLNETPIYSKDKKGYNISILVLQVMYMLLDKNYDALSDKIDALRRYVQRHLVEDEKYKSNIFLKMIIEADKQGYRSKPAQATTEALYKRLKDSQFSYVDTLDGLEIVPFTELWEIAMSCLR